MMRRNARGAVAGAVFSMWVLLGSQIRAQELPKGEDLMDKYVTVTGGKAAYEKCKNRVTRGTMEILGAGVKGSVTTYHAPPSKMYLEATLGGLGKFEQGTNGDIAWEKNAITGARIQKGEERTRALANALFNEEVEWRKAYNKVDCVGEEKIDDKPCYKVVLTTTEGQASTRYFDKESTLVVKITATVKTQMGDLPTESFLSDYKKVDGILIAHKLRQKVLTQEIVTVVDKVEHNVSLPENRFDLPEDIKKLAEKEKKDEKKPQR